MCKNLWVVTVAESFFQLFKRGRIKRRIYATSDEARADVFDYIELFYNTRRRHGYNNSLSPVQCEQQISERLESVEGIRGDSLCINGDVVVMKQGKNIAILGSRGIPAEFGGFETFAEQIAVRLVDKGFKVTVFCEDSIAYSGFDYKGVRLIYVKTPHVTGLRSVWFDVVSILRTLRGYDVVYMLGYHAAFAFFLPWLFRTNFWVNMDGLEWKRDKWSMLAKRYLSIMEWVAARLAHRLVADAQGIADYLQQACGVSHKTVMIPYGAYPVESSPCDVSVREMGYFPGQYYLVVCRLEPENHVLEIIQGFVASGLDGPLVIVGDNESGTDYVRELKDAASSKVNFIGTVFDQERLTALRYYSHAYLHGHSVGGTNPSLLEAMACSNYVIAHDNVFNREVTGGHALFFSTSEDVRECLSLRDRDGSTEQYRSAVFERIRKQYSWEKIVDRYEAEFIQSLDEQGGRTD